MHLTPSEKKIFDFVKEYAQQGRRSRGYPLDLNIKIFFKLVPKA